MNILYVYAHPNEKSFNHWLQGQALTLLKQAGHQIDVSDLYQIQFKATASWEDFTTEAVNSNQQYMIAQQQAWQHQTLSKDIIVEVDKLSRADVILFQFPLWWFSVPAILKGWFDRVLIKSVAYDAGRVFETGLLKGKKAGLILTTQSPASAYLPTGQHGPIEHYLHPIHHTLRFTGIDIIRPFVTFDTSNMDAEKKGQIQQLLLDYLSALNQEQ